MQQATMRKMKDLSSFNQDRAQELHLRKKLLHDRSFYAKSVLRIRTKEGHILPFEFNDVQKYIDSILDEQKETTGKVRAIILKGRQQGCSTYVAGRYYHKTTHIKGLRTFILTHDTKATANLFEMVRRYYEHTPEALRPVVGTSNQKELSFSMLDSSYHVGTAGSRGTGRSNTIQLFHGSEVAFWPHAAEHAAGALQAIPDGAGTEVILESTANGMGNYFHQQWVKAVAGKGEFIAIFIPWYWQKEYVKPVPENLVLEAEEIEYMETYSLNEAQMVWRRAKIESLGDPLLFKQEYPATPDEAFQFSGIESFISSEIVMKARKNSEFKTYGAIVAGYDPSQDGKDRDALIYRQGRNVFGLQYKDFKAVPQRIAFCKQILNNKTVPIDMLFIDYGGGGYEIHGMLVEAGYGDRVRVINSGKNADKPHLYVNKRAEMWGDMKDWFTNENVPVHIPDDNALHADIVAPGWKYDSNTRIQLESKKEIKKRELISPDGGDALALTFANVIIRDHLMNINKVKIAETNYDIFEGV